MQKPIRVTVDDISLNADLNDTGPAQRIWDALPIEATGNLWGDEIYFTIPVKSGHENPQEVVQVGDLAYWEPGSAFCIFYGPTPVSRGDEIRPASPVTVVGRIRGDCRFLRRVRSNPHVTIERAE